MNNLTTAILTILVFVPLSIFAATWLWNQVLVEAVTWANPITFWQMTGLMLLLWIIWPGTKTKIQMKDDE